MNRDQRFVPAAAFVFLFVLGGLAFTATQETSSRALYIIFDGSNSMWGELPDKSRKIEAAKNVFGGLDPSLFAGRDVALRIYGHRREGDCDDIELAVPLTTASDGVARMAERVEGVTPRGKTPITRSLQAALQDFDGRAGDILLISDGIETCDADPCDLVRSWRADDVAIRVHVVGLGLTDIAKSAMQCIAEASGTEYMDAESAIDLGRAIEQTASSDPPRPGEPAPAPQSPGAEFRVAGQDGDGNFLPVIGSLAHPERGAVDVQSNRRYVFEAGIYTLSVGVPTLNGVAYEPVTREVEVEEVGETRIVVTVPRPPRVSTRFVSAGEEIRGTIARSYQNDEEVFSLRPNEEHFVLPGAYEFRAELDQDNDLSIIETVSPGEDKVLLFEAVQTVRTIFAVRAEGSDAVLRQHQELHQSGELVYKVHWQRRDDWRLPERPFSQATFSRCRQEWTTRLWTESSIPIATCETWTNFGNSSTVPRTQAGGSTFW